VDEKHSLVEEDIAAEPLTLFDEEEVPVLAGEEQREDQAKEQLEGQALTDPGILIQNGLSFLSGLTKTLSDPEATRKLVSTIVTRDEKDGKTYLKLPVESEKAVESVLGLIGNLMKNLN
jgi:hypothetical protein